MIKLEWKRLCLFIFDIIVFSIVLSVYIFNLNDSIIESGNYYLSYVILIGSSYIILKFPATLFFFIGSYYKKIIIFKKELTINKTKIEFKKEMNYASIHFMMFYVVINITIAIILNDEAKTLFSDNELILSFISTSSLLLLTPSCVSAFNVILNLKKNTLSQYKNLIRNQFLANKDLFKEYSPINNFEHINFKNLAVKSKRGTFLLSNYEDANIKNKVIKINEEIIKIYHDLWKLYCNYLFLINSSDVKNKVNKFTNFNIQNFFDFIFNDFFDF